MKDYWPVPLLPRVARGLRKAIATGGRHEIRNGTLSSRIYSVSFPSCLFFPFSFFFLFLLLSFPAGDLYDRRCLAREVEKAPITRRKGAIFDAWGSTPCRNALVESRFRSAMLSLSLSLSAPRSCLTLSPEDYYFQRIGISSRPTATIRALLFFEEDGLEEKPARLARPPPPAIAGMLHPSFDLAGRGRGGGRLFGARARSYTLVGPRRDERETVADLSAVTPRPQPQCTRRAVRRGRANGGKMIHSS